MQLNATESLVFEKKLMELGYKKYFQSFNKSDFCYWKKFEKSYDEYDDESAGYQIGVAFYDFSKFPQHTEKNSMHITFHLLMGNGAKVGRLDITISDDKMSLADFEEFSADFYCMWLKKDYSITA